MVKGYHSPRSQGAIVNRRPSIVSTMDWTKCLVLLYCFCQLVVSTEPPCVIELSCAECVPDNMPLVTSHRAANGSVQVPGGDEVALSCGAGRLLAFPLRAALTARCEAGRYRVPLDGSLHILELGCQENVFEDVLHTVEHCSPPLQGRAYVLRDENQNTHHMATLCFDEDRAVATFAHVSNELGNALRMPSHSDQRAPLTLFGNFNHMFDSNTRSIAEKLYSDDVSLNRRLHELFKYEKISFAEQSLTAAGLLSGRYFDDQNSRVADFVSNKVAVWKSVARGNLEHMHRDVAKFIKLSRPHARVDVYAGTLGAMSLRAGGGRREALLRGARFPVPRYVWTLVLDRAARRALAVVVLNDPFVAVSEIRSAVFCESACARVAWLAALRRHRNYESALLGLTFCCGAHELAAAGALPAALLADVRAGRDGMLTDLYA